MTTMTTTKPSEWIDITHDWFRCLCGNEPHYEGFYSCEVWGEIVSPTPAWTNDHYVCGRCSRIIIGETGIVVGVCSEEVAHKNANCDWDKY
jgi:hypothetical protein